MVNLTTEVVRMIQIISTIGVMGILLATLLFLDYRKRKENRRDYLALTTSLYLLLATLLGIGIFEIITVKVNVSNLELVLFALSLAIMLVTIEGILKPEHVRTGMGRKIFVGILAILYIALIAVVVMIWAEGILNDNLDYSSLHLGSTLGLPALIMVTIGTVIVTTDESKFSLFHGFSAGGAWLLTLINTITLFMLNSYSEASVNLMKGYSGWLHTAHIVGGAVGLTFGFASALFGLSGQRRLAKITGYTTLGCWWLAYLLSFFITLGNL